MKKKRRRIIVWLLLFVMFVSTFLVPLTQVQAAVINGMYDTSSAKSFYDTLQGEGKNALFANGSVYFATKAKPASSSTSTRYRTVGYTVTVTDGTHTMEIEIDSRGGSYYSAVTPEDVKYADGFFYNLHAISYNNIRNLCANKYGAGSGAVQGVFSKSMISIRIDAIMAVVQNGSLKGDVIGENGSGSITTSGTVYRLKDASQLAGLKSWGFSGNFESYYNIKSYVTNNLLRISYYAEPKSISTGSASTSTAAVAGNGYSIGSGKVVSGSTQNVYQFQTVTIQNPSTYGLSKPGYHLVGGQEWKDGNGNIYSAGSVLHANQVNSGVNSSACTAELYANWKPNTYTIHYDTNSGTGTMPVQTKTFDNGSFTLATNTFERKGYSFTGWQMCTKTGSGLVPVAVTESMVSDKNDANEEGFVKPYTKLKNLSTQNNGEVWFKAVWEPNEYEISLDPHAPAGKTVDDYTSLFYETYETKFSLTSKGEPTTTVTVPTLFGYDFLGYYNGSDYYSTSAFITKDLNNPKTGHITFPDGTAQFAQDRTLIGAWEPLKSTVTLDADTDSTGAAVTPKTQTLTATYDKVMPSGIMPSKPGFTFKGFFTEKGGNGVRFYNQLMVPEHICDFVTDTTLYAYWVDEVKPNAEIIMESSAWTNSGDNTDIGQTGDGVYEIIFNAQDTGSGIDRMEIYRDNADDVLTLLHTVDGNGNRSISYTHKETEEGAIRFKVIAYDRFGNVSDEFYAVCLYDKSSPVIFHASSSYDISNLGNVKVTVEATDSRID